VSPERRGTKHAHTNQEKRNFVLAIDAEKCFHCIVHEPGYGARTKGHRLRSQANVLAQEPRIHAHETISPCLVLPAKALIVSSDKHHNRRAFQPWLVEGEVPKRRTVIPGLEELQDVVV
jgi:hypothetical protein